MNELPNDLIELCQQQALGQALSYWNPKKSYDKIMDNLEERNYPWISKHISVWEPFENWDCREVASQIDSLYRSYTEVALAALNKAGK